MTLEFSPDGTKLAVVTYELKPPDAAKLQATRIYQVSDGKPPYFQCRGSARCKFPWNSDGSLLVVSAVNGKEFDIYDTAKWQLKKHLTLTPPRKKADAASKDKKEEDPFGESPSQMQAVPGIVQALAFTRQGSLFAVTFAEDADSSYQLNHAKAWWDPLHSSEAESLGSCGGAWDMGVVSTGIDAMLALSYSPPLPAPTYPLNVSPRPRQFALRAVGKVELERPAPHSLVRRRRLRLTAGRKIISSLRDEQAPLDVITLSSSTGPQGGLLPSLRRTKAVKGSMILLEGARGALPATGVLPPTRPNPICASSAFPTASRCSKSCTSRARSRYRPTGRSWPWPITTTARFGSTVSTSACRAWCRPGA